MRQAEPLAPILAGQQHAPAAGQVRPLATVLIAPRGGEAGAQEYGMLAVFGVQLVDGSIDAAPALGAQRLAALGMKPS
jgi:hypothetical protein